MAILNVLSPYVDGETLTSSNLNNLVIDSTFASEAVDDITTQIGGASGKSIVICDNAIDRTKLKSELQGALERQASGGGYVGGLKTGTGFGTDSLTITTTQTSVAYVASGTSAVAIGNDVQATGLESVAFGHDAQAEANYAVAIGSDAEAQGLKCVAVGYNAEAKKATGDGETGNSVAMGHSVDARAGCVAIGKSCTAIGDADIGGRSFSAGISNTAGGAGVSEATAVGLFNQSTAFFSTAVGYANTNKTQYGSVFGANIKNETGSANVIEVGKWNEFSPSREAALNMQTSGQVAFTINSSDSAPTDGGATDGQEGSGELARGMYTIQKNTSDAVTMYYNDAGTIKSLSLGTLT